MQDQRLESQIRINRFGSNQESLFKLDTTTDWVAELLEEMQESLDQEDRPEGAALGLDIALASKENTALGEHFVVKGRFYGTYHTACVRCLIPTTLQLDNQFACCFLPDHLEKAPEYEETAEVFCDEQSMDLYFSRPRGVIDLKELIHEQIFMTLDPLPLHREDCKGLCMTCGINLNTEECPDTGKCPHKRLS